MNIDVEAVGRFHLQRCLHTGFREYAYRRVAPIHCIVESRANLGELRLLGFLLLRVVIAGNPPRGVVASHSKLRALLLYNEIIEIGLLWKFVAKAHAVVIDTEAENHDTVRLTLFQRNCQLVIVVAYLMRLSPYRLPCLVESRFLGIYKLEALHKVGFLQPLTGVLIFGELQS